MYAKKRPGTAHCLVGSQLAHFRRQAGLTQRQLAELMAASEETLASVEQGRRPLKLDTAEQLDELLQTKGALKVAVENMPEHDKYPAWAAEFIDLEQEALTLSSFENQVIPGLLQTENYARATFRSKIPVLDREECEERVKARIERQMVLQRKNPMTASFVISEAVLRDWLGGKAVYEEAVRHLREHANLPGVSIQILPLGREFHPALDGPFVLMETPEHEHLAYTETQRGSQIVSDQDEVSILAQKYAMLRTLALNPEETKGLLDRLLGEE